MNSGSTPRNTAHFVAWLCIRQSRINPSIYGIEELPTMAASV
jgi:hypothetical protein